jgi:surfeit locus 1 family protein
LVNRGWVPSDKKDAATRAEGNTQDEVVVEGALRGSFTPKMFTPANQPERNLWFWYDLSAMSKATSLNLLPALIDATSVKTVKGNILEKAPLPFPIEIKIRNDHMGYAITWFLIGLAALGVWAAHYVERKNKHVAQDPR